jgi:hypothetical protein
LNGAWSVTSDTVWSEHQPAANPYQLGATATSTSLRTRENIGQ